MLEIGYFSYIT